MLLKSLTLITYPFIGLIVPKQNRYGKPEKSMAGALETNAYIAFQKILPGRN